MCRAPFVVRRVSLIPHLPYPVFDLVDLQRISQFKKHDYICKKDNIL